METMLDPCAAAEVVNGMNEAALDHLLNLLREVDVTISQPPRTGLLMQTVLDSFDTPFNLGEVLVTQARVVCCGGEGFGMVIGEQPRRALAKAAVDAIIRSREPAPVLDSLLMLLDEQKRQQLNRSAREASLIAATKVNFDLMPGA